MQLIVILEQQHSQQQQQTGFWIDTDLHLVG